jgi:hypothetical protein
MRPGPPDAWREIEVDLLEDARDADPTEYFLPDEAELDSTS